MPKMKEVRRGKKKLDRRWTDHRAAVLEEVATAPYTTTRAAVQAAVLKMGYSDFHKDSISAMVSRLLSDGYLGMKEDQTLFITAVGLECLTHGDFTKPLPGFRERPGRQGKKYGPRKPRGK